MSLFELWKVAIEGLHDAAAALVQEFFVRGVEVTAGPAIFFNVSSTVSFASFLLSETALQLPLDRWLDYILPAAAQPANAFLLAAVPRAVGKVFLYPASVYTGVYLLCLALCGLILLVALTCLICIWPLLLLIGTCKVVVSELFEARSPRLRALKEAQRLGKLSETAHRWDLALQRPWTPTAISYIMYPTAPLAPAWLALIDAPLPQLYKALDVCVLASSWWQPNALGMSFGTARAGATALTDLLLSHISRRTSTSTAVSGFSTTTDELAGVFFGLLPSSHFDHLARPFRLGTFLPFILPHPLPYHFCRFFQWRRPPMERYSNASSAHPVVTDFGSQLVALLLTLQAAGGAEDDIRTYVREWLDVVEATERAPRAEKEAHEAILDAVLRWKARKEHEAKESRRVKAE
ncbi:hypothetical protein JCM8097_005938 [Rhodosporidiobolus ruineniae]